MENEDTVSVHNQEAAQYDQQVHDYNSYAHDALFGMSFEYVKPGERILDIGIGTGLASRSFAKIGMDVYGCDGSVEMLKVCETKAFAKDLKVFDLKNIPLPYTDNFFNHVVCCGVLHFFSDLDSIMKEVKRVIKSGGIFAFTVAALTLEEESAAGEKRKDYFETPTPWGVSIYTHGVGYITSLLRDNGFDVLKSQKLLIRGGPEENSEDMLFRAYVAREAKTINA